MTEVKIESIDGSTSWSDGVPLYIGSSATNNANRTLLLEVRRYGGVFGGGPRGERRGGDEESDGKVLMQ